MFFNNSNKKDILEAVKLLQSYVNNDINSLEFKNNCSGIDRQIMEELISLSTTMQNRQKEDLSIYGEIMLCAEKLSDGFTDDRISKKCSNEKLNYIAKSINLMSEKLEQSLSLVDKVLLEYSQQNFLSSLDEQMFRGGEFQNLLKGINHLKEQITQNLKLTYRTSLVIQKESSRLLENSTKLSQSTTQQAASLEEASAAIEEIATTISNNTQTATKMSQYGQEVKNEIDDGLALANKTVCAMNEINESTKDVHESLEIIDQIAFQTNILSLNAAVEAATAGEAGKGFAVVAQEVRNLATRSAQAAKDIKDLVESATQKAQEGKNISDTMIEGYESLNENINETTQLIQKVVSASKEQETSIHLINSTVTQIDSLTQQNANVAEDVKLISLQMNKIADKNTENINKSKFVGKDELQIREDNKNRSFDGKDRREDIIN